MNLFQAATILLVLNTAPSKASKSSKSKTSKSTKTSKASEASRREICPLERIPINVNDFREPHWETIIEAAFPTWKTPENGCPRLDALGGTLLPKYSEFPTSEDGKWNPCYYTKGFASLDPKLGGYPSPIDTRYPFEFAAPFKGQPGDGSVHHCEVEPDGKWEDTDIGACPKLGNTCGKDCAQITNEYGIGHIPPFVPLAAIKNAYGKCGSHDICSDWFHYPTNGCNIKKSVLDDLVYEQFGVDDKIKFQGPVLIDGLPSNTYFRLEYGGESPACDDDNCRGPHYCTTDVIDEGGIWGDFCPYVHTGENSGKYRHPHIALAALELWIANQCMPDKCASTWLDTPNGEKYGKDPLLSTAITWSEMDDNTDPMSQPKTPYAPNSGDELYPGLETLYPTNADNGACAKSAPGLYVTEIAGQGFDCSA